MLLLKMERMNAFDIRYVACCLLLSGQKANPTVEMLYLF